MTIRQILLTSLIGLNFAPICPAQPATQPTQEQAGPIFRSLSAGISLQQPAGMKAIRGPLGSNEIVRFVDEQGLLTLRLNRVLLEPDKPMPLTGFTDQAGQQRSGMFDLILEQLKSEMPGCEILRQDTINIADGSVGILAARYSLGKQSRLIQQAVIRASDLDYFILTMNCPAPRGDEISDDPLVRRAVDIFSQVLDSVALIDQTPIRQDQNQRLLRTRQLLVNLTEQKLRQSLRGQQFFRLLRDGKDVGWQCVVEQVADDLPQKNSPSTRQSGRQGVLVGVRSYLSGPDGTSTDSQGWFFCAFDRTQESFWTLSQISDSRLGKLSSGQFGLIHRKASLPDDGDVAADRASQYWLQVVKLGTDLPQATTPDTDNRAIDRPVPPFYLPQALGQLMPRLMPLDQPGNYLFACWVAQACEIMLRYVDVQKEQELTLNGRRCRAVIVNDRVGLEGPLTTHYLSPLGQYLGSLDEQTRLMTLPSSQEELQKIWPEADLGPPAAVDRLK